LPAGLPPARREGQTLASAPSPHPLAAKVQLIAVAAPIKDALLMAVDGGSRFHSRLSSR
jgi:hypothetical protein